MTVAKPRSKSVLRSGWFWATWACVPIAVLVIHLGPGQRWLARDIAARHLTLAALAASNDEFMVAADEYAAARNALPETDAAARQRLDLAEVRARLDNGDFVEAVSQLEGLLGAALDPHANPHANAKDQPRIDQLRAEIAKGSYYTAWMMRLEGATEDEWKPETEKARQHYRLLTESGVDTHDNAKNLEAVIRLELMSLTDLEALPLPKKCQNCSNCSNEKRKQRLSKCQGKKPDDARSDANQQMSQTASWGKGS